MNQIVTTQKRSLVDSMAAKYEMEPQAFMGAVKATCIKGECSNEQFAAFLMVAKEYDLNPLTKEIYAFPDRGGITPIVSIDGWMNLINSHPQFDGLEFVDSMGDDGKLYSVECKMYRKDRQRPTTVIEYMSECFRQTDPWKKWPNRMLRHKSAIQCARYAFGFSGIMEPDEYERMKDVTPAAQPSVMERLRSAPQHPADEREGFDASFVHSETETALTGELIDNTDTDETPLSQSVDAGMKPAEGEVENPPAASPSNPSVDQLWLLNTTRMLWGATKAGGDPEVFKNQRLAAMDQFPKPDDCDKRISDKANSVSRHCREIIDGSLYPEDGLAVIAGIVGVDQDDILRQAGAA